MAVVINTRYLRRRRFARLRYGRKFKRFDTSEVTALAASATGKTISPVRTPNTKAEGLVTFGGQPSANDFLNINGVTFTYKSALTEVKATGTLTNDGTNVLTTETVTIDNVLYTFKTSLTEAKAAVTLTNDGTNVLNTETVTLGSTVYTFKTTLTEAKAAVTLTNDGTNVTNGDTVTVGGRTYTFQTVLTNVDGNVFIGASNTASMTNLFHAINASGGTPGTDYAASTTANANVTATNPTGTTVVCTAKTVGVAGNAIASTETSSHLAFGSVTLLGGVDSIANEVKIGAANTNSMTNLFEAINAGANAGTDYSTATVIHPTVSATNPTGTTVVLTAKSPGPLGNVATTETSIHLSFGAATLTGGVAAVPGEVLIDSTAATSRDNLMNAINAGAGAGTKYATGTVAQPAVVASASGANLLLTAAQIVTLQRGKDVKLTKSGANLTLSGSTLDGPGWTATAHGFADGTGPYKVTNAGGALPVGTPTVQLWLHKIDANTIALATSHEALRNGNFIQTTSAGTGTQTVTRDVTTFGIYETLKRNKAITIIKAVDIDNLR